MKIVNGVYTSAKIFTDTIEEYALAQIRMLCGQKAFSGCRVRVMPDVHPGKVGAIGFTSTVGEQRSVSIHMRDRLRMENPVYRNRRIGYNYIRRIYAEEFGILWNGIFQKE